MGRRKEEKRKSIPPRSKLFSFDKAPSINFRILSMRSSRAGWRHVGGRRLERCYVSKWFQDRRRGRGLGKYGIEHTKVFQRTLLLALLWALAVHEVVETDGALHQVVETTKDTEDTKGEDPNTDDGNNGGLATNEPTEESEEGGDDVDDQDSTSELPRWDGRPEWAVGTGDEDEPVLGKGDFQEQDGVTSTEVLDDTTGLTASEHGGKGDPGADSEDDTEENGHTPELGQVPLDGSLGEGSIVVGDGKGSDIGENGNEDNEVEVKRLVQDGNPKTQEDFQMERKGDTVDNVGIHTMEDLAGGLEGIDDGRETGGKEDNIGGGTGSVGGTLDGNTSIGLLQRWSIVDTVTSHGNEVATLLQDLDDIVLVLGENFSETIGSLNEIVDFGTGHGATATETEALSVVDISSETELTRGFTSDTDGITSQHLDGETESLGLVDGLSGIVTGGIGARHDTEDLPGAFTTLAGNTERAETTGSEFSDLVLVGGVDVLGDGVVFLDGLENEERSTLDAGDGLTLGGLDDGGDLLGDGIEGLEVKDLVLGEDGLGTGVEAERLQERLVDGVDTLLLAGGGQTGSQHEIIGLDTLDGVGLSERELVLGQGTGLVGAEDFNTGKRFNGGELLDDGLLLGEVGGTDSHGGGDDSGQTDGDTDDGDTEGELEDVDDAVGAVERGNPDDEEGDDDQDQENRTDAVEDLGEMTGAGRGRVDKGSGTTDEGVVTGGGDDHEGLTTLDGGGSVAVVHLVLVDSKGFTGKSGLIDLEESLFGDDTAISGDDGTLLDLEDITGNDLGGFNLNKTTVAENDGLEGKSLFQFIDDRTGLEFLDETNTGVEQEETANDTEIDPILETGSKNSSSLSKGTKPSLVILLPGYSSVSVYL